MIRDAGFEVTSLERYRFLIPPVDPQKPHVLGVARKPPIVSSKEGEGSAPAGVG